jgi:hypothetical protein
MLRKALLAVAVGAVCLASQGSAWATKYFYLHNDQSTPIVALWVSPHATDNWGGQVLSEWLSPGDFTKISWARTQPFYRDYLIANGILTPVSQHKLWLAHLANHQTTTTTLHNLQAYTHYLYAQALHINPLLKFPEMDQPE